jgi:phthiocerol/phenolphthiocerol synthesis type-I polyketide synthase E
MCVISGTKNATEALEKELVKRGIRCNYLLTSHAFHSQMVEPILTSFFEYVKKIDLKPPHMRYVSNVTGTWITAEQATDPKYWTSHLRQTVRFSDGVAELLKAGNTILLEIGPGRTLSILAKQGSNVADTQLVLSSLRHPKEQESDVAFLLKTVGRLWMAGANIDWGGFYKKERRHRMPLPTYPFERQRYWIEPVGPAIPGITIVSKSSNIEKQTFDHARPEVPTAYATAANEVEQNIAEIWKALLGIEKVGVFDNYFELGGDSLSASQVVSRIRQAFGVEIPMDKFFEDPSVSALAKYVKESHWVKEESDRRPKEKLTGYMEL